MPQSFLQSKSWANFQESLGRQVFVFIENGSEVRAFKYDLRLGGYYLYLPYPQPLDDSVLAWAEKNARSQKMIFIKIEPSSQADVQKLLAKNFEESAKEIQTSKNAVLNLEATKEAILSTMYAKTRYNIGLASKHEIRVEENRESDEFWSLMEKTTARDKFSSHSRDYYQKLLIFFDSDPEIKVKLFTAYKDKTPLASAMILIWRERGFYLHGASDYQYRNLMAPYILHWRTIEHLKEMNIKSYDFLGVDEKKWPGLTRFKMSFGAKVVEYPGAFDLPISRMYYRLYKILRRSK